MTPQEPPSPSSEDSKSNETWKVNVPASDAPAMSDAPDEGYATVKYSKDGDAFCVNLESLEPCESPASDPSDEDDSGDTGGYGSLRDALSKQMKKSPASTDDGAGDEG